MLEESFCHVILEDSAMLRLKSKITAKDLSYILGIRQQSLNETLQKLEKEGYIVRTPIP